MTEQVDVVVVGLGPGGEEVAGRLAEAGLSVVGIDERLVGGECPYYGCVPTKMMIRAGNALAEGRRIPGLAGTSTVEPDWAPVAQRIRDEATDDWDDKVAVDRLVGKGAKFVRGRGRVVGPGRVAVGDQEFEARRGIVLATGTAPAIPPVDGLAGTPYWTNREAVPATEVPGSLLVLGGGAIGSELSQVFARFGAQVTVVEASHGLIAMEEPESSALLAKIFAAEGITVRTGVRAQQVKHDGDRFTVVLDTGDEVTGERLLVATGRRIDLDALGVASIGLDTTARVLPVNDRLSAGPGVWGVGDVVGKGAFTHVAMYHAAIVVREILGQDGPPADHRALPRVTFTDPEIGAVGVTEAAARKAGVRVRVGHVDLPSVSRGWIHKAGNEGFIKVVEDADRGVLIGATSAGPTGGEVLAGLAVAVHGEVPVERLRHMIYAYPTFHRGIETAINALA